MADRQRVESRAEVPPNWSTGFFTAHPDMGVPGYEPAGVDGATVRVLVRQDTTIFAPPNRGCCTDEFITASVIWQDGYTHTHTDAVNALRQLLHFRADTAYDLRWMHVQ